MKKIIIKSTNERGEYKREYKGASVPMSVIDTGNGADTIVFDDDIMPLKWWSFIFYPTPKVLNWFELKPNESEKFIQGALFAANCIFIFIIFLKIWGAIYGY